MILRDHPDAVHVRLDGPPQRRVAQAMELEGFSKSDAERLRRDGDRAREAYVRHFYGCDARDPALYHLVIDSTRLGTETVVEVIARRYALNSGRITPRASVWNARLKPTKAGETSSLMSSFSTSSAWTAKTYRCGGSPSGGAAPPHAFSP